EPSTLPTTAVWRSARSAVRPPAAGAMKPDDSDAAARFTAGATDVCCRLAITPISASDSVANASLRVEIGPRSEISSRILARFLPPCSYNADTRFPDAWTSCPRLSSWPDICVRSCTTVPDPEVPVRDPARSASASFANRDVRHKLHQEHPERVDADRHRNRIDHRRKEHGGRAAVQQFANAEVSIDTGRQRQDRGG